MIRIVSLNIRLGQAGGVEAGYKGGVRKRLPWWIHGMKEEEMGGNLEEASWRVRQRRQYGSGQKTSSNKRLVGVQIEGTRRHPGGRITLGRGGVGVGGQGVGVVSVKNIGTRRHTRSGGVVIGNQAY